MTFYILSRAASLGSICILVLGVSLDVAAAELPGPSSPAPLTLACHVFGGGYAIEDMSGRVVENGDSMPFSPQLHAVLYVTAIPPRVRVAEGTLPHPDCASGPVLERFAPIEFNWCSAHYEILPGVAGTYILRSASRSTLTTGPHQGDIMAAFMIGECALATAPG